MEDLNGLEAMIRRIAREEITRALGAVGAVAYEVYGEAPVDSAVEASSDMLHRTMQRVARDVLANEHPELHPVHRSTPDVHTITAVPERSRAACTCVRHGHVLGLRGHRCRAAGCYCLSPEHARPGHTSTEAPRTCPVCKHDEHDQGRCGWPVYLRGVASPCPCLASRTLGAQPSTPPNPMCTVCGHTEHGGHIGHKCACGCTGPKPEHTSTEAPRTCPTCKHGVHEAGKCAMHVYLRGVAYPCPCLEWVRPEAVVSTPPNPMCTVCEHAPHGAGNCGTTYTVQGIEFRCACGGRA